MTLPSSATVDATVHPPVTPIVALDVADRRAAQAIVSRLGGSCGFYKVGLELFAAEGPDIVSWLRDAGKSVFVDLKLHDIPNTVRGAARSVARHGASLLTVHASGGSAMIRAAGEGAEEGAATGALGGCGILGVTILTSMDAAAIGEAWGRERVDVTGEVVRLAGLVATGGGAGIVCSGHEAAAVHATFGAALGLLIPGIRLPGGDAHDQRRVMTPRAAADAGARWLILGRAVTGAADPVAAMGQVTASLAGAV
ncbi:orotidine-5'-phosphate decarboxylase [Gemmatimonas groenlandica]|uniref:Orotidine 5'-phosphate decarboxylase n=1 Tax=Gemmatimonas groenlandica TaxID=2732249 RepID=A0A6M4IL87_9BACT|nr:orotidine-5'-phosphate decarboxylase [Gemmatimonas groenlandica]QJR34815.1 orotidine-5'-phosphate decarboxylase [Gemmatimonas groenlandica]